MNDIKEFEISRHSNELGTFILRADIKDGCLTISGQDLGLIAEQVWGDSDYEFMYQFDRDNTMLFIAVVEAENAGVESAFRRMFGSFDAGKILRDICKQYGITYTFYSCI